MIISKNFELDELCRSETADRLGIKNIPNDKQILNLKRLVQEILQPLRDKLGQALVITSAFRNQRVNRSVGGSEKSQHMEGEAADIRVPNMKVKELIDIIAGLELPYHQLINEFDSWVHVSIAPNGTKAKKQVLYFKRTK